VFYRLLLEALPSDTSPENRLKHALKTLGRWYRLKCRRVEEVQDGK